MIKKIVIIAVVILVGYILFQRATSLFSQQDNYVDNEEVLQGKIVEILGVEDVVFDNREYISQELKVVITSGSIEKRTISVDSPLVPKFNEQRFEEGNEVLIGYMDGGVNNESFYIIGYSRTKPLLILLGLFLTLVFVVARKQSLYSLLGMTASLAILVLYILPLIANGANPLYTAAGGMLAMIPVLFYISHGFNKKTTAAVVGTAASLIITAIVGVIFVDAAHLTGITFDEVETLLYLREGNIDLQGILLAGILMGALGVIDDVAITQASIVEELLQTNPRLSFKEVTSKAMNVGRDHIASVINTLILVYVGGSLTTLLLFSEFPRPPFVLLNSEVIALQIVIALIGSIGLIIAIPTTTILAAWINQKFKK